MEQLQEDGVGLGPESPTSRKSAFVCPIDKQALWPEQDSLACRTCGTRFPIVNGVPVLINDQNSVFQVADYLGAAAYKGASGYGGSADTVSGWRRSYRHFARKLSEARIPGTQFDANARVLSLMPNAKILVIGAGERKYEGNVTYTDVVFAAGVSCISDAHDLPFEDGSFDAVFAEAVLEHVCDPQRCVAEMTRVLQPRGFVMAVTPFLQPVHMGAYDFTRFTYLGHRRLFRFFDHIESGMHGGPIYSAIHLARHLAMAVTDRPRLRAGLRLASLLVTYPLRHADRLMSQTEGAYNSACAFYFFGQKRDTPIPDREIIKMFRGK